MNKKVWTFGAAILLAAGLAYVHAADVAKDEVAGRDGAMVAAAQSKCDQLMQLFARGHFDDQDAIYVWSRRVLEAETRAARGNRRALLDAAQAHEKRMVQLNDVRGQLVAAGQALKTPANEFYLLEAKALVEDAGREQ